MRTFLLLAALAFFTACTHAGAVAGPAEFRKVSEGGYASATTRGASLAKDEAAYRAMWSELIGSETAPAIDFATETAVFLTGGQFPTGGHTINVRGVTVEENVIVVDAGVQSPGGGMAAQVITTPYVVLAVKSRGVDTVNWVQ